MDYLIALISENSVHSEWVKKRIGYCNEQGNRWKKSYSDSYSCWKM